MNGKRTLRILSDGGDGKDAEDKTRRTRGTRKLHGKASHELQCDFLGNSWRSFCCAHKPLTNLYMRLTSICADNNSY